MADTAPEYEVSRTATLQHIRIMPQDEALPARVAERFGVDPDEALELIAEAGRAEHPSAVHNTDIGNASQLVQAHGGSIRYLYEQSRWLAWNGCCWAPDVTGAVERFAKDTVRRMYLEAGTLKADDDRLAAGKWAVASESAGRLEAMIRLARSDERVVVRASDLDSDPWALNVTNGTVDLKTGTLRPHNPDEMHSKTAAAALGPDANGDRWEAFLLEVLPDPEVRRFVQKAVGYSLTGEIGERILPFTYGSGANGKSVFLGVLRKVLGDYATEAAPELLVARRDRGGTTDIAALRGFRFVTTTEVEGGRRMATDVMKRITGETDLTARRLYQEYESFPNVTKLWMAANDRPQVDGLDDAIWHRVRLVPFTVTISAERRDPFLAQKLLEERDAILAWAVAGCLAWQEEGLNAPAAVSAATEEYRDDSNPLGDWVESECELDPEAFTPAKQLRESHERWSTFQRVRKVPRGSKWAEALGRLGCLEERRTVGGRQVRGWAGVRVLSRERSGLGGLGV